LLLLDGQVHHDTHPIPMGNYVSEVGKYLSANPSDLGNYVSADNPAGSTFIRGGSWHSETHAQTRQARPAARCGQSNAIPRHPQGSRDCLRIPWACAGQTLDHQ
jgi:hypothetical protein